MGADIAIVAHGIGWLSLLLAAAGTGYMIAVAVVLPRFFAKAPPAPPASGEGVTILKPLYGSEPRLGENLASFLDQRHAGPIQLLCGVQRADDPAIAAVEQLRRERPDARIDLIRDSRAHGANGKVSNLINLEPHIAHPIIVLSDSDIAVAPDYLARLLVALDSPNAGAVTCLYRGRGDAGFWSVLGAAGLSWQFLPGAVFGVALGLARPCMGSTIAIRQETLARIGGFARFADILADDYALGEAVHALGRRVVVPPMLVTHGSDERSFAELWRHELRWAATVRGVVPGAYAGSVVGMPVPLALLGVLLGASWHIGLALTLLALLARALVIARVERQAGGRTAPLWLLPMRDCITFTIFVASFFVRSVDWRGARLRMDSDGQIAAHPETD